ncbi:MAG TPA: AgmX/PglI C-terminal domain-containing protein [Pseudomonadota bacterium]|mgnify:FL=1|jgi:hypothetical protein|nr:AgmX/PglI C-terminal domain-containing protein [Pseudomonadota bacterium]HND09008.1 AgmX/PglI C-terminal domain-containing protein [Pseudomonadota bacterium]HNF98541.1 AgmX/PglI C-terminal domain-containing protein [Pseudomonadota bacterium]HNI60332.1 AgmX/PglI C-terminal domain-containing protein [Pseudomonadota bacterium]HNK44016.1 AgmX/PglI C-terminal domain-containing protein [Pseudomonadota bacterium]
MLKLTRSIPGLFAFSLVVLAGCHGYKDTGIATVRQNNNDLKSCLQEASARNPNLKGMMELAFEIGPDGKVNRFGFAKDEYKDQMLSDCVKAKATTWQFPAPPSGKMEQFTYKFGSAN